MDTFSSEKRSEIMSSIRGKNTTPELIVFCYLKRNNKYFQKHYKTKHGYVVDLALPRKKKIVFIDGDFWHGKTINKVIERRGPDDFWSRKILRNVERDNEQKKKLLSDGWQILRVWESDLKRKSTVSEALNNIESFLYET